MSAEGKFSDLTARTLSAVVMVVVGIGAIWLGGWWFLALCAAVAGLVVWELSRMIDPASRLEIPLAIVAAAAVLAAKLGPWSVAVPALVLPSIAGAALLKSHRGLFAAYALLALVASFGLDFLRDVMGLQVVVWLIAVVIASDVAGYFAGRVIGGPKFWPKVSPKKTWSGTVAGWLAAALVGLAILPGGVMIALLSAVTAFAGQMGDVAESAIKRKMGVKDSSNLIPGHGGVMDRFDALMGAAALVFVVIMASGFSYATVLP